MFELEYKGGNAVMIATKNSKIWVDSNLSLVGLTSPKLQEAVQLATEARFLVDGTDSLVFEGPGDYEIGDFTIHGVAARRHIDTENDGFKTTMYRISAGEIRLALLGNIAAELNEDQLEGLGVVDILVVPVGGGGYTLDATSAVNLVRQIEPTIVVPVHYSESGISYEVPQDSIDAFVKELAAPVETMNKLKLKSSAALPPALTVYQLDLVK